jgi:hypothetical protein
MCDLAGRRGGEGTHVRPRRPQEGFGGSPHDNPFRLARFRRERARRQWGGVEGSPTDNPDACPPRKARELLHEPPPNPPPPRYDDAFFPYIEKHLDGTSIKSALGTDEVLLLYVRAKRAQRRARKDHQRQRSGLHGLYYG